MKDNFREARVKYHKLKEKFLDELNSAGLRISTRSEKIKQAVKKQQQQQKFIHNYYKNQTKKNYISSNNTRAIDQYEYDNLDSKDQSDELEIVENMEGICDQIEWNVINNDSTIYKLTTALISDQIVCSFSNVEPDIEYRHVCEYG